MDILNAATAIHSLGLKAVIPIHNNTIPDLKAESQELVDDMKLKNIDAQVVILNPGERQVLTL